MVLCKLGRRSNNEYLSATSLVFIILHNKHISMNKILITILFFAALLPARLYAQENEDKLDLPGVAKK